MAKLQLDISHHFGDMAFTKFKMAAATILNFTRVWNDIINP